MFSYIIGCLIGLAMFVCLRYSLAPLSQLLLFRPLCGIL